MTPLNSILSRLFTSFDRLVLGVFCVLALTACGKAQSDSHTNTVNVEAQFQPVVNAFAAEAQAQGTPVTITDLIVQSVEDFTTNGEMGVCIQEDGTTPTVQISQSLWNTLDADGQQELLFHELGHCVLNRAHETTENNGVPISVMSPTFLGSSLYDANRAQYMHELFTGKNVSASLTMVIPPNTFLPNFSSANGF